MYYRNANCAVVVYDITQAVYILPSQLHQQLSTNTEPVLPRQSQIMGQRAPTTGQRKHHHRSRRQQARSCHGQSIQADHHHRRCASLRSRIRAAVLRNISEDGGERTRPLYSDCEKATARAGRTKKLEVEPAIRCGSKTRGTRDAGRGGLQLLSIKRFPSL